MSKNREKRLELLYSQLRKSAHAGGVSIEVLEKCLHIKSRQTIYNYIAELVNRGYEIGRKEGKTSLFYIEAYDKKTDKRSKKEDIVEPIDENAIKRFFIRRLLQSGGMTKEEIKKRWKKEISDLRGSYKANLRDEKLNELLEDMKSRGDVISRKRMTVVKENRREQRERFELSPRNIPVVLELDEDEIYNLYYQIDCLSKDVPSRKHWDRIRKKIELLIHEQMHEKEDCYIVVGRKLTNFKSIQERSQVLSGLPFQNYVLRVLIEDKNREKKWHELEIGALIYSVEKDKLYLLASRRIKSRPGRRDQSRRKEANIIIDMKKVLGAELTDKENHWFGGDECELLLDTSFSVSDEAPVRIEVLFDKTNKNEDRLKKLMRHRPYAICEQMDNKLLLVDGISGLSDFASYLRQFGGDCEVVTPIKLRDMMRVSAEKTLKRYGEEVK